MYKALNNIEEVEAYFEECGTAVFPNTGGLSVDNITLKNFFRLDYRISNPRLLSLDEETKVSGGPFSQTQFANYIFGVVVVGDVLPEDPCSLVVGDAMQDVYAEIKRRVAVALSHSNKENLSGDMAVFVGDSEFASDYLDITEDNFPKNTLVFPFFMSTSVFYNPYRVTLGAMNEDEGRKKILDSLIPNFKRKFGEKNFILSVLSLNPEETKEIEDVGDVIGEFVNEALDKHNGLFPSDSKFSASDGWI